MDSAVNVEQLISEVEKRPLLWDSSDEQYKYKNLTKEAWLDICQTIIPNFDEMPVREQQVIASRVNHKWRNIRDNFTRDLRLRFEGNTTKKRKYIFADRLEFLLKAKRQKSGDNICNDSSSNSEIDIANDQDLRVLHSNINNATFKLKEEVFEDNSLPYEDISPQPTTSQDNSCSSINTSVPQSTNTFEFTDDDKLFFESLLPSLRTLDTDSKLEFRIEVLGILRKLKKKQERL